MMQCDWPIDVAQNKRLGAFAGYSPTGYEEIPTWIMQGHMTLAVEAYEQLAETKQPVATHLILQAGGSFCWQCYGLFVEKWRKYPFNIIVVEPRIRPTVFINPQLWMMVNPLRHWRYGDDNGRGLRGEPNIISWPIIRDNTSCFIPLMTVWRLRVCVFRRAAFQYGWPPLFPASPSSYWRRVTL